MKKIKIIMLMFIMLGLFTSFFNPFSSGFSEKRKMAFRIVKSLSEKYKAKFGLNYLGISEEAPEGKYRSIGLELSYNKILSKDEGRILLLHCVKDALEAFNSYPNFKQYMENNPFTGKNIIINIYIRPSRTTIVYSPDIAIFSFYDDTLMYDTKCPENRFKLFTEEESYEEALRIVESQRSGN